jgi:hypothetical protein
VTCRRPAARPPSSCTSFRICPGRAGSAWKACGRGEFGIGVQRVAVAAAEPTLTAGEDRPLLGSQRCAVGRDDRRLRSAVPGMLSARARFPGCYQSGAVARSSRLPSTAKTTDLVPATTKKLLYLQIDVTENHGGRHTVTRIHRRHQPLPGPGCCRDVQKISVKMQAFSAISGAGRRIAPLAQGLSPSEILNIWRTDAVPGSGPECRRGDIRQICKICH